MKFYHSQEKVERRVKDKYPVFEFDETKWQETMNGMTNMRNLT